MMGLNEDWLLCSSSSQSAARNLLISACDSSSSPSSKEALPEKRSEGVVIPLARTTTRPPWRPTSRTWKMRRRAAMLWSPPWRMEEDPLSPMSSLRMRRAGLPESGSRASWDPFSQRREGITQRGRRRRRRTRVLPQHHLFIHCLHFFSCPHPRRRWTPECRKHLLYERWASMLTRIPSSHITLWREIPSAKARGRKGVRPGTQPSGRPLRLILNLLSRVWKGSLRVLKPAGLQGKPELLLSSI
ncbi:Ubiquitin carboxyl-terminal hydrolase [Caligus rogercresseyi]|uniref:Ubiquitin carboxyl-terminal hydrolase n=1 Tax=Caligus rogercresseyi TaxID=217165 RepID=A0A7T8GK54_CALRO|nr:Ubiquitin carboxyl-terminal hydrolase [Caligus rogercresseyi]